MYGDDGYSYDNLYASYLKDAKIVTIQEPHLLNKFQIYNFLNFCETVVKVGSCNKLILTTKIEDTPEDTVKVQDALTAIKESLADKGIELDFTFVDKRNCHDRFIETDTGWYIDCGRGLHIYQNVNPNQNFLTIGTYDQELRPCLACTINYSKKTKQ